MKRLIIGCSLDHISYGIIEIGLSLSTSLGFKPHVIHAEHFSDFGTIDNVFVDLNFENQENYISTLLQANTAILEKEISNYLRDYKNLSFESKLGRPADVLIDEATNNDVELMILGYNKDKNLVEKFLGGVTEGVLHRSEKSILVVKNSNITEPKKIMVAYDFSHHCNEALEWTKQFAMKFHSEVHLVNVVPFYYEGYHLAHPYASGFNSIEEEVIDESVKKVQARLEGLCEGTPEFRNHKTEVIIDKEGSISNKIVDYASNNDIDLVIVGSHKKGFVEELFLGSVTGKILKKSTTSILVAK